MQYELLKARLVAFLYEAGTLVVLAICGALVSPEFSAAVTTHFGDGITGSLILLSVSGVVKHVRNMKVLAESGSDLGSTDGGVTSRKPVVLI